MAVTPDDRYALPAADDRSVMLWDLDRAEALAMFMADSDPFGIVLAKDGKHLYALEESGRQHILEILV